MKKKLIALVLATVTTLGAISIPSITVKADINNHAKGWVKDKSSWHYLDKNGTVLTVRQGINGHGTT